MNNVPTKFFGVSTTNIKTPEEAACALRGFCQMADHNDIYEARKELRRLSIDNRGLYDLINELLWSLEFDLGSKGWDNRYLLLNAAI